MLSSLLLWAAASLAAQEEALRFQQPYCVTRIVCAETNGLRAADGPAMGEFPDGRLLCVWCTGREDAPPGNRICGSVLLPGAETWGAPRVFVETTGVTYASPALHFAQGKGLWLFYARAAEDGTAGLCLVASGDGGYTWSEERVLCEGQGLAPAGAVLTLAGGALLLTVCDAKENAFRSLISEDGGTTWMLSEPAGVGLAACAPTAFERSDGQVGCYVTGAEPNRVWTMASADDGRTWTQATPLPLVHYDAPLRLLRLASRNLVAVMKTRPGDSQPLTVMASADDGNTWGASRALEGAAAAHAPALVQARDGIVHVAFASPAGAVAHVAANEAWMWEHALIHKPVTLANVAPSVEPPAPRPDLPIVVEPFVEHVRGFVLGAPEGEITSIKVDTTGELLIKTDPAATLADGSRINALAELDGLIWYGTETGLYAVASEKDVGIRQEAYGVGGPLASRITALAADSEGTLWVGTPLGLSLLGRDKSWRHIRGKEGLPVEDVTALAVDEQDRVWIGTSRGAILHLPKAPGRQWFYRAGKRYLPGDCVKAIALAPGGMPAYFLTDGGIGRLDALPVTLERKARIIEERVNERHRRMGLVGSCLLDNADVPTAHTVPDNDNDGLWTAYHVAAMALCYGATGDEEAKRSARESMHALYMLQNASGTPGLVARSVVSAEEGKDKGEQARARLPRSQWRPTPDGTMYWKSDTSNDELDGHYLAFYTYYEHIARFDLAERDLLEKQIRAVTDYIVDHGYQLIDWDGERTSWGFWDPNTLNEDTAHYAENGLNSLQLLSFLKVAQYVTGDAKYFEHYSRLITDYGYLSNVLLEKKLFPDENNHSDNQLAFVAWYPLLQLERDPIVREALLRAVQRHYEVVRPERSSFYTFVYATVDPGNADVEAGIENLRQIPTNRRCYAVVNSTRDDVAWADRPNRFGRRVLAHVLPVDERAFDKWNQDPYEPDHEGDGRLEDDGAAYLLPYWMARYHRFIAEAASAPAE